TLRRAALVVTISEFTRRDVIAYGVPAQRIVIIHPGAQSRTAARTSPDGDKGADADRIILTVARLGELYKGHDMLVRAMPLILARDPRAVYVIVGDGPLRPYLERLAASLRVADAITFTGSLPNDGVDEGDRRADLFAPLRREAPLGGRRR